MTAGGAESSGVGLAGGRAVRSLTRVLRRLTNTMHILMCHFRDGISIYLPDYQRFKHELCI